MAEAKSERLEREYVIPLKAKFNKVPRYKKTNRAVKAIKEFLAQHMKIRDRDLDKIKVDKFLNEYMWSRGIKNPPSKIKVKAVKEDGIVKVHLAELPLDLKFKKERIEKRNKAAVEIAEKKKSTMEKLKEMREKKEEETKSEIPAEETKEKEEKKAASIEAGKELEKEAAKMAKKETKQSSQPKHQRRMALQK